MPAKKRSPTQTKQMQSLFDVITDLLSDFRHPELLPGMLPPEWQHLDMTPVPERAKITLRLDKDVTKFFRGLGPGYQGRMNLVLRAFMLAYLSDTLGRVSDDVQTADWSGLSVDEKHELEMEISYLKLVREMRERRAQRKSLPQRRKGD